MTIDLAKHSAVTALSLTTFVALSNVGQPWLLAQSIPDQQIDRQTPQITGLNREAAPVPVPTQAEPDAAETNLKNWMYALNRSDIRSPEAVLAHIVTCLFTRDTGAMAASNGIAIDTGLDRWLTSQGKQSKRELASLDLSSPWLNTLYLENRLASTDGNRITYQLRGTLRTSEANSFYPIELSIQMVRNEQGQWLADRFQLRSAFSLAPRPSATEQTLYRYF